MSRYLKPEEVIPQSKLIPPQGEGFPPFPKRCYASLIKTAEAGLKGAALLASADVGLIDNLENEAAAQRVTDKTVSPQVLCQLPNEGLSFPRSLCPRKLVAPNPILHHSKFNIPASTLHESRTPSDEQ